ncbi:3-dehydroquinate synthase [Limnovirga soli]|uniref:3-dehydroquinate synthase n=1 Tax=Limnovirga soli TaxID=2656915 RepID=A0A8J8JYS2_9BACT|nr:3-dehydroquinate synthase [Limnovirga soli]NNV57591.1 3-dehydroquinate synthase [Limnovirga soli]
MKQIELSFSNSSTTFLFNASFAAVTTFTAIDNTVIITDENVFNKHKRTFKGWQTIVLPAGEQFKNQATIDNIINQLISLGANRKTFLVGVGGGVVTDITGYVAGIYMRGLSFGFVPTSILAMVDASIGGKNGIDVGLYKNMVGLIRQPAFLLYDYSLLSSLPRAEWINGFAEIIKHAAIKDAAMFRMLEQHKLIDFKKDTKLLDKLIQRNALLKAKVVQEDEFEQGDRKLLNFGHTFGHAIENSYQLPHGHAVTIGMIVAAVFSEVYKKFADTPRLTKLIQQYGLPVYQAFNAKKVLAVMQSDKKKVKDEMHYVLLAKIGKAVVQTIPVSDIEKMVLQLAKNKA